MALLRLGPEFPANFNPDPVHHRPATVVNGLGEFIVVWEKETSGGAIEGRRFDSFGNPVGSDFQLSESSYKLPKHPEIAGDVNTLVVWQVSNAQDGAYLGVFARPIDSTGNPVGSEFQVNTYTIGYQGYPDVSLGGLNRFVTVWDSSDQDGNGIGVFAQRFDSSGGKIGTEFQVNAYTPGDQSFPRVGANSETGDFVVVWQDNARDGSMSGIFSKRFTSAGVSVGTEFQVNVFTLGFQFDADVVAMVDDSFVVTWVSAAAEGVVGRRFDSGGAPIGGEFQVSTATVYGVASARLSADDAGEFVISWRDGPEAGAGLDGDLYGVFARRFASDGSPNGSQFQVNVVTADRQYRPAVDMTFDGNFVVVWETHYTAGSYSYEGIHGQRFLATCGDGNINTWETCDPPDFSTCNEFCQSMPPPAVGPEFQVNTVTASVQAYPSIAVSGGGNFLVVWQGGPSEISDVKGQLYQSDGDPQGTEFLVNSHTSAPQYAARAAAQSSASFVVVWTSYAQDGDSGGIFGARFDSLGLALGTEFQVNTTTAGNSLRPDVAVGPSDFVVVWSQYGGEVRAQRFNSGGSKIGTEFQITPTSFPLATFSYQVRVAENQSSEFVVVWSDTDNSQQGVFARRFDSANNPIGSEFLVNTFTGGTQSIPAIGMDASGNFVVSWFGVGPPDGSLEGIFARRFASDGSPLSEAFVVNSYTSNYGQSVDLHVADDGSFVVSWEGFSDGAAYGIFARRFDSAGGPIGFDFQVNSFTFEAQSLPSIGGLPNGDFAVVWSSNNQDGDFSGIFGQRFLPNCGNGVIDTWETCDPPDGNLCLPNCQGAP